VLAKREPGGADSKKEKEKPMRLSLSFWLLRVRSIYTEETMIWKLQKEKPGGQTILSQTFPTSEEQRDARKLGGGNLAMAHCKGVPETRTREGNVAAKERFEKASCLDQLQQWVDSMVGAKVASRGVLCLNARVPSVSVGIA